MSATEERHDEEKLGFLIWLTLRKMRQLVQLNIELSEGRENVIISLVFAHSSKTIGSVTAKSRIRSPSVLTNKQREVGPTRLTVRTFWIELAHDRWQPSVNQSYIDSAKGHQ